MTAHIENTHTNQLNQHLQSLRESTKTSIGFPAAVDFNYEELYPFFDFMLNNVGDPYDDPLYKAHTKSFEREVVNFFADMFRLPLNDRWGYVTSGGSEGNLYALYLARELYPTGQLYYSAASHYSVEKAGSLLRIPATEVKAQPSGEIDYQDMRAAIAAHPDQPAIVVANIGTTMTEAKDNIAKIKAVLDELGVTAHYIHSDAALAAIPSAVADDHTPFDIADGADSISLSGHKFIGSPMPCGIVLARDSLRQRLTRDGKYTGSADTTITGSRNGHTVLIMWKAIKHWGQEGFRRRAQAGLELAAYTVRRLEQAGVKAWRNPGALTVVFKSPKAAIVNKWQLATYDGWSHLMCMPGITRKQIDAFVDDLTAEA